MNTPGHAVVSVALAESFGARPLALAVLAGAVLPDLPIALLYLDGRFRQHLSAERIWAELYPKRFWQDLIHGLHSLPLAAAGVGLGFALGRSWLVGFFVSVLFHALVDLPIHGTDAHRHFFPLSHYKFISPLSYWDVSRHARVVLAVEMVVVLVAGMALWRSEPSVLVRAVLVGVGLVYLDLYRRLFVPVAVEGA